MASSTLYEGSQQQHLVVMLDGTLSTRPATVEAWSNQISSVRTLTSVKGEVYAIKASQLYRVNPSTVQLTALSGGAAWGGTVFMAGRNWAY